MKWIACVAALASCQGGNAGTAPAPAATPPDRPPVSAAYREDVATVCDVVHLSKADEAPPNDRWPTIAIWLGPHIKTAEGRAFVVAIQPLTGEPKAMALEAEARRVGLAGCALAAEWR